MAQLPLPGDTALEVRRADRLTPTEVAEVLDLVHAASGTDGVPPLSEHVVLHLRHGGDAPAVHLLSRVPEPGSGSGLVGYAHITTVLEGAAVGTAAEVAVHPWYRRRGLGRCLVTEAMRVADERADGRLRLWAHGDHPAASALARNLGFERARVLWQMRRSLLAEVPEPVLPAGVTLRAFRPGTDDEPWLELNAKSFAEHPDQGRWTRHDLQIRLREPWFDPAGFLLAERDGTLVGFHWTKIHDEVPAPPDEAEGAIGEVYVLGVAPEAHGTGLGTALTLAGLRHLRARGLDRAMLYVDESNPSATRLYTRLGFARWSTDVLFRRVE